LGSTLEWAGSSNTSSNVRACSEMRSMRETLSATWSVNAGL
jgi:hypothetical protein